MARISYDSAAATAFAATREVHRHGLAAWRAETAHHLRHCRGLRLLDLGSGTGMWAEAFVDWHHIDVVAVEPSEAMRDRCAHRPLLAGDAEALPLADGSVDAAWLSTMIHHIPDLTAAAAELRRVVRAGGPVLIRSPFPGRHDGITLFRHFPEAIRVLATYPSLEDVRAAFARSGFTPVALRGIPQETSPSLREVAATFSRKAHTPLQLISDAEYAAGVDRLRTAAAAAPDDPVIDVLDLLVLR